MKKMVLALLMAAMSSAALAQEPLYEDAGEIVSAQELLDGYMNNYRLFSDTYTHRRAVVTGVAEDPYPAMGRAIVAYEIEGSGAFEGVQANLEYSPGSFGRSIQAGDPLSMSCVVSGFANGLVHLEECLPASPY